jgi:sugar lactone lactonase YvrE
MQFSDPELLLDAHAYLGEGPAWDSARQRLYWVDIIAGHLHYFDPQSRQDDFIEVGQALGCVAPMRSGGVILGFKNGLASLDISTLKLTAITNPETDLPGNRFNDGKCDPEGRFLAGTMDNAEQLATGSLYSLGPGGLIKTLLTGIRISNGLAWSPDYKSLYFIDTPTRKVMAYDYDLHTGDIGNPRIVVTIPEDMGWPDGMTSDTYGRLWVALWGGAALTVWDQASGRLLEKIPIPAKNVTSCAFGGPDQNELFITSARKGLNPADLSNFPATGGLFRIQTNVTGLPTFVFNDDPQG